MNKVEIIDIVRENPGVKIRHISFGSDEYLYSKEDGNLYDENNYLFEDYHSYKRNDGMRIRQGDYWINGWSIIFEKGTCEILSKSESGRQYLYIFKCKTCMNRECKYMN